MCLSSCRSTWCCWLQDLNRSNAKCTFVNVNFLAVGAFLEESDNALLVEGMLWIARKSCHPVMWLECCETKLASRKVTWCCTLLVLCPSCLWLVREVCYTNLHRCLQLSFLARTNNYKKDSKEKVKALQCKDENVLEVIVLYISITENDWN